MQPPAKSSIAKRWRTYAAGIALFIVLITPAACDPSTTTTKPSPTETGPANPLAPGSYRFTITTPDGRARAYVVYVSDSVDQDAPAPVVLNLHGGGGSADGQAHTTNMDETADAHGFILVYPEGIPSPGSPPETPRATWNATDACCGPASNNAVDDVGYFRQLLDDLKTRLWVDSKRVYATGISNGGIMTYRLACQASDIIAAIAPVAPPGLEVQPCEPTRAVPTLHIHGTDDQCADYQGGEACGGCLHDYMNALFPSLMVEPVTWPCEPIDSYVADWRQQHGCPESGEVSYTKGAANCTTWGPCANDSEVTLCLIDGAGHTWPSGQHINICQTAPNAPACTLWIDEVGTISTDMANENIWAFLSRHQLP